MSSIGGKPYRKNSVVITPTHFLFLSIKELLCFARLTRGSPWLHIPDCKEYLTNFLFVVNKTPTQNSCFAVSTNLKLLCYDTYPVLIKPILHWYTERPTLNQTS